MRVDRPLSRTVLRQASVPAAGWAAFFASRLSERGGRSWKDQGFPLARGSGRRANAGHLLLNKQNACALQIQAITCGGNINREARSRGAGDGSAPTGARE